MASGLTGLDFARRWRRSFRLRSMLLALGAVWLVFTLYSLAEFSTASTSVEAELAERAERFAVLMADSAGPALFDFNTVAVSQRRAAWAPGGTWSARGCSTPMRIAQAAAMACSARSRCGPAR